MADDKTPAKKTTEKSTASAAGKKLVARVALKGDFDAHDGLGVACLLYTSDAADDS